MEDNKEMNYLSLFSGVEGGGLAFQHLIEPKITCIGYVENDDYCQKVIKQRQIDGLLDKAPIYGDIRTFIDSGCAALYQGVADVVAAGFPCQPFSVAGKRKGEQDERNMWPHTIATICLVRPRYAFLENVPGLLASGYMPRIFSDLAEAGYNARWTMLSAADCGAPHKRERVWMVATDNRHERIQGQWKKPLYRFNPFSWCENVRGVEDLQNRPDMPEPLIWRKSNGMAHKMDRLKAIGNGQVPQVAALAWKILINERINQNR